MDSQNNVPFDESLMENQLPVQEFLNDPLSGIQTEYLSTQEFHSTPFPEFNTIESPHNHQTQPTQIIDRGTSRTPKGDEVQVPASSPLLDARVSNSPVNSIPTQLLNNGQPRSAPPAPMGLAPPGTALRRPMNLVGRQSPSPGPQTQGTPRHSQGQPFPHMHPSQRQGLQQQQQQPGRQQQWAPQGPQQNGQHQFPNGMQGHNPAALTPAQQHAMAHARYSGMVPQGYAPQPHMNVFGFPTGEMVPQQPMPNMQPQFNVYQPRYAGSLPYSAAKNIDLSDDELLKYQGGYSEDDSQQNRDIKPSKIKFKTPLVGPQHGQAIPGTGRQQFNQLIANSYYQPQTAQYIPQPNIQMPQRSMKRPGGDLLTTAYGGYERPMKLQRQTLPMGMPQTIRLEDIQDPEMRNRIQRVRAVIPAPVSMCYSALVKHHGNEPDAMAFLVEQQRIIHAQRVYHARQAMHPVDAPDELAMGQYRQYRPTAKQQLKGPAQTIQQRYGQHAGMRRDLQQPTNVPTLIVKPALGRRKKLMKGRKHADSDEESEPDLGETSSDDSGVELHQEDDVSYDEEVLDFFNKHSVEDLMDIANLERPKAEHILSFRPFDSLANVEAIQDPDFKPNPKARKQPRTMGDKIVEYVQQMWRGYQAVEALVEKCSELRNPITKGIAAWGVDVVGLSKEGEMALSTIRKEGSSAPSLKDSGVGTPTTVDEVDSPSKASINLTPPPKIMAEGVVLKEFQLIGMNWLTLLYTNNLSCILADDMGLGKTIQVIAFLAHLWEAGVRGTHIIIVPSSVLENWLREFQKFCPSLEVMPYYGEKDRGELRDKLLEQKPNILVTTYSYAQQEKDRKFLSKLKPLSCIFDEGHMLKNANTKRYRELMQINPKWRVLLTGTPLQNNLQELTSLLAFMMPELFRSEAEALANIFKHKAKTTDSSTHDALLSAQRIARARSMMAPFILRRKKYQVLQDLVKKTRRVVSCDLHEKQKEIYDELVEQRRKILEERKAAKDAGEKPQITSSTNHLMGLRKASIHPLLFRRIYDDKKLAKMCKAYKTATPDEKRSVEELVEDNWHFHDFGIHKRVEEHPATAKFALQNEEWMVSGKVTKLVEIVKDFKESGDRALIFSQFTMTLDILEEVFETIGMKFYRIDGTTPVNERQLLIDEFEANEDVTIFMLTTKAGGAGLNLTAANKVILFDQSYNPQDDIQAENRAHRVGQTREVEVVRLVTKDTIEEQIFALGKSKLELDDRVAGESNVPTGDGSAEIKSEEDLKFDQAMEAKKIAEALGIEEADGEGVIDEEEVKLV